MVRQLTKTEAQAFQQRWQRVNEYEKAELRGTPLELRLKQFNTLLSWAQTLGWGQALAEGEEEVRQRWVRLRKAFRV